MTKMRRFIILLVLSGVGIVGHVARVVPAQPVLAVPAPGPPGTQRYLIVPGDSSVTYRVQETHFFVAGSV